MRTVGDAASGELGVAAQRAGLIADAFELHATTAFDRRASSALSHWAKSPVKRLAPVCPQVMLGSR